MRLAMRGGRQSRAGAGTGRKVAPLLAWGGAAARSIDGAGAWGPPGVGAGRGADHRAAPHAPFPKNFLQIAKGSVTVPSTINVNQGVPDHEASRILPSQHCRAGALRPGPGGAEVQSA